MDLYFQGRACFSKGLIAEHMTQARGYYEQALARDPGNIDALVGTAWVDDQRGSNFLVDDPAALFAAAEATLIKALALAPENASAHLCLAHVQIHTNRAAQGIAECERALSLDRNLASAHAVAGTGELFMGRAEKTEAHINEALRLSPHDTFAYTWLAIAGLAKLFVSRDEEAVALLRR
jgi:tetratricopeptide (TPR) repeat protein